MNYTGDVTVEATWQALANDSGAVLIDVRTEPEWAYVGFCDLSALAKTPLFISWQTYPTMAVNPDFAAQIAACQLEKDQALYFLCRSGVRSKAAAAALYTAGYATTFNVLEGFEGNLDSKHHRGIQGGWKAAGLPWRQS